MRVRHTEKVPRVPVLGMGADYLDPVTPQARSAPRQEMLLFCAISANTGSAHTHSVYMFLLFNIWASLLVTLTGGGIKQETVLQDRLEEQQLSDEFLRDVCM